MGLGAATYTQLVEFGTAIQEVPFYIGFGNVGTGVVSVPSHMSLSAQPKKCLTKQLTMKNWTYLSTFMYQIF